MLFQMHKLFERALNIIARIILHTKTVNGVCLRRVEQKKFLREKTENIDNCLFCVSLSEENSELLKSCKQKIL